MSAYVDSKNSLPAGAFEKIAVSSSAIGITSTLVTVNEAGGLKKRAVSALISVETNSIRLRIDGTDPDASTGHLLAAGDYITIQGESNISRLKMIRASADAVVQVTIFYNR